MRPVTKAMGSNAAITVKVASMVGPPTSLTAAGMTSSRDFPSSMRCRWMFSTTTMASSTSMPMEKIRANSDTRFSVKPHAHEANSVMARVSITAPPTTTASRLPRVNNTSNTTDTVANTSFWISLLALSLAVTP